MEHGIRPMKIIGSYFLAVCVLLAASTAYALAQRIVIVTGQQSKIKAISGKNVRRAYLGASVVLDGVEVKPILNQSDDLTDEVFMQKIMFMSVEAYKRQLLTHAFRGGNSPKPYRSLAALLDELDHGNATISFMLYETAIKTPGIRIIDNP